MKRFLILMMIFGLILGSVAPAEAEPGERTVEATYGPYPAPITGCNSVGGSFACLIVPTGASESFFTAKVTDLHGQPVFVQVKSAGRTWAFCGETTEPIAFEPSSDLHFFLVLPNWPLDMCLECPTNRIKTTGTISVSLWGPGFPESPSPPSESPAPPSPSPDEPPTTPPSDPPATVERSVDLELRGHLRSVGAVVTDDASCRSDVPVVIQRKTSAGWVEVGSTTTGTDGDFAIRLKDRSGRYRAVASESSTSERTCPIAVSAILRHRH